jgi:hypothetical protein
MVRLTADDSTAGRNDGWVSIPTAEKPGWPLLAQVAAQVPHQRRWACPINLAAWLRIEYRFWSGARDLNPGPHGPEI